MCNYRVWPIFSFLLIRYRYIEYRWYIAIIDPYIDPSVLYGRVYSGDAFYLQLWSKTILSQYDGATGEFLTLTPSLGAIPCAYRHDISLKTRFFELHFCRRIYRRIFNHFYAMRPGSYRILCRSRSFKVTDFGTSRKLIYDFLLVITLTYLLLGDKLV